MLVETAPSARLLAEGVARAVFSGLVEVEEALKPLLNLRVADPAETRNLILPITPGPHLLLFHSE